jgi:hypothetical protein
MRLARYLILLCSVVVLGACTTTPPLHGPPTDLQAVFHQATQQHRTAPPLQQKTLPVGPEVPYIPVMQPPMVQRVWIPDHLNDHDDLVSGHWVYLLLEPSQWFLETYPVSPTPALRVPLAAPTPPHNPAASSAQTFKQRKPQPPNTIGKPSPQTPRRKERQ